MVFYKFLYKFVYKFLFNLVYKFLYKFLLVTQTKGPYKQSSLYSLSPLLKHTKNILLIYLFRQVQCRSFYFISMVFSPSSLPCISGFLFEKSVSDKVFYDGPIALKLPYVHGRGRGCGDIVDNLWISLGKPVD